MFNKFFSTTLMKIFPRIFSLTLALLLLSCFTASCAADPVGHGQGEMKAAGKVTDESRKMVDIVDAREIDKNKEIVDSEKNVDVKENSLPEKEHDSEQNKEAKRAKVPESKKLSLVCTSFPPFDLARSVAGDQAELTMLLKPGAESHTYEPTPQDIKKIAEADLFITVGGENDAWVDHLLDSLGDKKPEIFKLVEAVDTVEEELVEGMEDEEEHEHEHAHEHESSHKIDKDEAKHEANEDDEHEIDEHEAACAVDKDAATHNFDKQEMSHAIDRHDAERASDKHEAEHEIDEHVWTAPQNFSLMAEKLASRLAEMDPEHAERFAENARTTAQQFDKLDKEIRQIVDHAKRKTLIFADRFPLRYFADAYGLDYFAAFSGCSVNTEASPKTVAFLIDKVKEEKIPVVFTIEFSSGKIARAVCEATGAKHRTFHSCHNISADELARGETTLNLMEKNLEVLKEALND